MKGDFLVKIRAVYNQLTKAEKKVADYILKNPKDVLFMSITDLADACEVGDTSVFRFCKTMNLKGYQEFKMMLSLSLHEGDVERDQFSGNISEKDSFREMAQKVLNTNVNALMETFSLLDQKQFMETIDVLYQAERVCFFGVGASALTALKATNKFIRIEPKVYCLQDSHMQAMMAATMRPTDVAVIFSYSGATKDTIHVAELAKKAAPKWSVLLVL